MSKKLIPVTNYVEPEYPEIEGIVASEEADCSGYDLCSTDYYVYTYLGSDGPGYQYIHVYNGCSCQDSQCECSDGWWNLW